MAAYPGWLLDTGCDPDEEGPPAEPDELAHLDLALDVCKMLVEYQRLVEGKAPAQDTEWRLAAAITKAQIVEGLLEEQEAKRARDWQAQQDYRPEF